MRRKDLAVGDRVLVRLPYDGGRGWARVLDLDADPLGNRATWSILVRFEGGQTARNLSTEHNARLVAPNHIVRHSSPSDETLRARGFVIHWLNTKGERYASSTIDARSFPAALRRAATLLSKTAAHPSFPNSRNPIGACGFWVEEAS